MKFSCTQENLKRGLMATGYAANKNLNLPILNNVLIKIEEAGIHLISTNLEIAVRCLVRGKVESPGEFTLPSKLFLDYVNLLPDDRVDLELAESAMKIACRKNSTKIKGIPAAEFPLIPVIERQKVFYLSGSAFKKALNQVNFAVSSVESRPELTGALFSFNPIHAKGQVVIAATDSYRLSEKIIGLEKDATHVSSEAAAPVIIPGKTLTELARILSLFKESELDTNFVEVAFGESQVAFKFGDIELISRLIDGKYPDYKPIIPERFTTEAIFHKSEVAQAVKSASLFSKAGLQDVHLRLDPKEGLVVSSNEGQMGKNDSVVEAKIDGPSNAIVLNYRYFLDGLSAVDGPRARLKMIDAMNPCVLAPEEEAPTEKTTYIVMPIKQ